MHTTATLHALYTPPYKALPLRLADSLHRLAQRGWLAFEESRRRRAQRATVLYLQELDDHLLHDLGIDRSELASIAANPGDLSRRRA